LLRVRLCRGDLAEVRRLPPRSLLVMPLGQTRAASGRSGGMLTQMIPRLHSITERLRHGTSWTGAISRLYVEKGDVCDGHLHVMSILRRVCKYVIRTMAAMHALLKSISFPYNLRCIAHPAPPAKSKQSITRCFFGMLSFHRYGQGSAQRMMSVATFIEELAYR